MKNTVRFAAAALIALASGPSALAQTTPPSGGVSSLSISQSGISLEVNPQSGVTAGVDAGENGGLTVGAGPQGATLNLRPGSTPSLPGVTPSPSPGSPASPSSQSPASRPDSGGAAPATSPARPEGTAAVVASPKPARRAQSTGRERGGASNGGERGTSTTRAPERSAKTDPAANRGGPLGVAPVFDLLEQIPAAVWAGLVALALIATAMWMLWIRGRRRLERNAWVDADSGAMNLVAFETVLAQEWDRSVRYRRPLGLLLIELEESTADGGRRPLSGKRLDDARETINQNARQADTVAQLSPSRLSVICPESPHGSVETLARALESSFEAEQVHARVGIGERLEEDRGPADLVSRAASGLDADSWELPIGPEQATVALHVAA